MPTSSSRRSARAPFAARSTADDVAGLTAVYKAGAAEGGFASGIELVISTILQSPSFVYRVELGQKPGSIAGAVKLTPYEVASRLSYFIWGTMPDQLLFEAADAGKLGNADGIAAQVERMMKDPRARTTLVGLQPAPVRHRHHRRGQQGSDGSTRSSTTT